MEKQLIADVLGYLNTHLSESGACYHGVGICHCSLFDTVGMLEDISNENETFAPEIISRVKAACVAELQACLSFWRSEGDIYEVVKVRMLLNRLNSSI